LPIKDNKVFICCGLRCYKSVIKHIAGAKQNNTSNDGKSWLSWSNDGPQTGVNSLQILLDWITTAGNYSRFTGGVGGETKLTVAGEIRNKIQSAGIVANRTPESIITKIYELVNSYKQAHHIKSQTGESMENVYAACKYFDALDPILGSRPSVQPRVTNKTIEAGKSLEDDSTVESSGLLSNGITKVELTSSVIKKRASVATTCKDVAEKVSIIFILCDYYLIGNN